MSKLTLIWILVTALSVLTFQAGPVTGQPLPVHAGTRILRSGSLVVEVGDPESAECRWNKGLRFSPVANVLRAQLRGHEFLYSPVNGGALTYLGGLPMEFDIGQEAFQPDPPGYNEGNNGAPFLKIGVGILQRNASAYNFSANYPVVELAHTTVTWHEDRAQFVQTLTGSATALGVVQTSFILPFLLISPLAGAMVDRYNRKLMMMVSDLGAVIGTSAILILNMAGILEIWHLSLVSVIYGLSGAFQWPAYSAAISTMVPKEQYGRANGMMFLVDSGPAVFSPILAGILLPIIGLTGILVLDVATFFLAIGAQSSTLYRPWSNSSWASWSASASISPSASRT